MVNGRGLETPPGLKQIGLDFDGVLHSYKSGWQGADNITDEPNEYAIGYLRALLSVNGIKVNIFSSRNFQEGGVQAMKDWLIKNGLDDHLVELIDFPLEKKGFFVMLDDRAIQFSGKFPTIDELINFKPWYNK